ncbi:MAG: HAMP domain-containing sensor histidine kinase [Pelovirga sp.]
MAKKVVGLRTEILVTLTFLLVAALLLGGLLMLRLTEQRLLEERLRHLDEVVRLTAVALAQQNIQKIDDNGESLRQRLLNHFSEKDHCHGLWLFDQNLNLIESFVAADSEPLSAARRQQVKLTGRVEQRVNFPVLLNIFSDTAAGVSLAVPITSHQRFAGIIEVYFSLEDIRLQVIDSLQLLLVYVILYGLVLIAAGYYLLQRNIIRPANLLLQATQDVGRGDLETRLPVAGPTELAQLAIAYNEMVHALKSSRAETRTHIDELEHTNNQLQQARHELIRSEKMASVGQLAAGLAHELGNPLAALIGYLELLKQRITGAEADVVERSLSEARRIDYLVRELLNFSRPTDNTSVETIDPVTELRTCRELLSHQGAFGHLRIDDLLPDRGGAVRINRQKLHQVFINLLINAAHACGRNGEIKLTAGIEQALLRITIRDNGCGIDSADLTQIFDPFYTTKPPGEGTGLGLTICHRIIDEAGGRLEVDSRPGEGSSFRLVLPLALSRESK